MKDTEMFGYAAGLEDTRNACKIFGRKIRKGEIALQIAAGLRKIMYDGVQRIKLARDRIQWRTLVGLVMNLPVP
jgi:hypothetical protein